MSETAIDPSTNRPFDDVVTKNIRVDVDHPLIDSDEESLRRLGSVTGEGRPAKAYEWSGEALRESGPSESAHAQMKRAANMMGNKRREAFSDELQARAGIDADTAAAVTDHITDGPPPAVRATRTDGTYLPELRDDVPVLDQLQNGNDIPHSQLKLAGRNFRDAQAAEAQQLLWELGQREQEATSAQAVEQAAAQQVQQPAPQPTPQPQPAPAIEAERARLAAERQALARLHSRSIEEREKIHEAVQIRQWWDTNYPPQVRTPEGFAELERSNPAHAQYLRQWVPAAVQRDSEIRNELNAAQTIRSAQMIQVEKAQRQQREEWAKGERGKFMDQLQKDHPQIRVGTAAYNRLNAATAEVLNSDPELRKDYDNFGASRSALGLRLITDRAMLKLMHTTAKNVASKRLPPVSHAPGVHRPAGSEALEDVAALTKQLENTRGDREALRIAAKLTRAKRAAGQL